LLEKEKATLFEAENLVDLLQKLDR